MKRILGLDLGTNSIGWAVILADINEDGNLELYRIEASGSRIIPMDAAILGDFDRGNSISQTAERTRMRGIRHLRERELLRRERLHRVLNLCKFLPCHYADKLDRYGHFLKNEEPKIAWHKNSMGKPEFLFQESFNEMLEDFQLNHPQLAADGKRIPYDWTIYYLRKKALTERISKEELAWILLNFNQKRGYYQLRGEEDESNKNKLIEYHALKVVSVEDSGDRKGKDVWYNVHLENGWIYRRASSVPLDWVGKTKEFIVTTDLENDGTPKKDKEGNVKRSFRAPKEDDWTLVKEKTQADIVLTGKTVGEYIYDTLLQQPTQKIRGKLVRTIERKFYKEELTRILESQKKFHSELQDRDLYTACVEELYPSNVAHRNNIANRDFVYLFIDDILFYQRPLKSKKSLIDNCPYESHKGKDTDSENKKSYPLKCIAKSHPLYQEFRLWQFVSNLHIHKKGAANDLDVTADFIKSEEDYVNLFDWLNDRKSIDQKSLLKYPPFGIKKDADHYRWNYVEDKVYPCNETRATILTRLEKAGIPSNFLTKDVEVALWHLLYSVSDKEELSKALAKFANRYSLDGKFVEVFQKCPPFEKEYGAYSAKAIKKLLSLMRCGKYWNEQEIDDATKKRIERILTGEWDENISNRVREKAIHLNELYDFRGLPLWLACYVVYDRHSEANEVLKWNTPDDVEQYLKAFKQHSLRNPIVEQVITETLRTVRDIWKQVGQIDEIHIELGREMKNPADKRKRMTERALQNENANLRIKALLMEFMNPEFEIENVRPYSPSQQDILRIYEEGVFNSVSELPEDISAILKKFNESDIKKRPTRSEVLKYKLWLEQKYQSPYTGEMIPLGKLFTPAYEIEHIIPQSRYFDDSFNNKVICESEVNKLKDNSLGYEFIKKHHGEKVELSFGRVVNIFTEDQYEDFVKRHYASNRDKMRKLLMDNIPEEFISRQLNDSRYISKLVKALLSSIVREEGEEEAISKNVIVCTGGVTDRLKKDWGINDVWNKIIIPRFQRLNELTGTNQFTTYTTNGHEVPSMPLELQKGFNKKRIDHRHHAMDAIVIACANRNIVNYLNNESASAKAKTSRHDLQALLCDKVKTDANGNYKWQVKKPWDTFTQDVYAALNEIVVSFKQNLRVINKATNYYTKYDEATGKKAICKQGGINEPINWAIRKPMHKDTVFGEVNLRKKKAVSLNEALKQPQRIVEQDFKKRVIAMLREGWDAKRIKKFFEENKDVWADINLAKIEVYYFTKETKERFFATRKQIDTTFDRKKIETSVTDTGIQQILLRHLENNGGDPVLAFSEDGIDEMNKNITLLNGGKYHHPIRKVRVYEKADKFSIGQGGNKATKYVEAAKGTNLYFAIYEKEFVDESTGKVSKKRTYATVPLNIVIERLKNGLSPAPADDNGNEPKYVLSPNDLVYIPFEGEDKKTMVIDKNRIYKFVSCTSNEAHFIPSYIANPILQTIELGSNNKAQKSWSNEMIKEVCVPITIDRLGNIRLRD